MKENRPEKQITIPAEELDRLFAGCDGSAALLYLYVRRVGSFSLEEASRALKCTKAELQAAAETLRSLGLMDDGPMRLERVETPEYTARDVTDRAGADPAFEAVVKEAERALGRVLSSSDLKLLFGVYDYWGLQPDVIMMLLHFCVERYERQNGAGRRPAMRYIEKEAQFWANHEITTLDAVDEYLRREKEKQALQGQIRELLQIHGRELTAGERSYVDGWLNMGFGPEAIAVAYDRTVVSTGRLTWNYMDKMMQDWHKKGLYTPADIEAGDPRRSTARPGGESGPAAQRSSEAEKLETMRRMYAKMQESGKK